MGVTVEAASPVLTRKGSSTVSDDTGVYRLTELLLHASLTFTLPGFATVKRDAVDMGAGVITLNTDMRVGEIQETITVTGETPSSTCRAHGGSKSSPTRL